jgi:DNA-binding CsgD family transcriptional regulator
MAAPLTPAQRDEYGTEAYRLSLRGQSAPTIARTLGVSEKTVDRLLKIERERVRARRDKEDHGDADLVQFLGEQDAVLADVWRRLEEVKPDAAIVASLQSNAARCSVNKAKALGLFVDKVAQTDTERNDFDWGELMRAANEEKRKEREAVREAALKDRDPRAS